MVDLIYTPIALLILIIWSAVYKQTIVFRVVLSSFVGVQMGFYFARYVQTTFWVQTFKPLIEGNYILIIPVILGFMLFIRFFKPKHRMLSLYPAVLLLAFTLGQTVAGNLIGMVYSQFIATMKIPTTGDPLTIFNAVFGLVTVVTTMIYFVVTVEHKGLLGVVARIGRFLVLMSLGAAFGLFMMSRIGMVAGKLNYLTSVWLGL
ncbi:MAG: hypothetical protein V1915_02670 [Candidatus Bathyarchaeota archaeon]